jgi:hypothetical protein
MKKGDIPTLNQLVITLKQLELKLEESYMKKDPGTFNNAKNMMLKIQKQISSILK